MLVAVFFLLWLDYYKGVNQSTPTCYKIKIAIQEESLNSKEEAKTAWPISVTVGALLGIGVAITWFLNEPSLESLSNVLPVVFGEAGILVFFGFRRSRVQKQADAIVATVLLILVPLLTITAYSYDSLPPEDPPAIQTVVAYLQTVESINDKLTAIPQTVAALEGQDSAPTATALANQQTELESTRSAIPTISAASTIPAARLTLTPLVAKISSTVNAISADKIALTNPASGQLVHDQDRLLEETFSPVSVKNFETRAKFYNPYDATLHGFDFGFIFRISIVEGSNTCLCYRLQVNSDGRYELVLVRDVNPTDFDLLYSDTFDLEFLNTGDGEVNDLRLIVFEDDAYFYLNNNYIAKLNVSERLNAGGISLATGLRTTNELSGYVTRYEDFTIWQILDE